MYERMLNKIVIPTVEEMTTYCGDNSQLFTELNDWLTSTYETEQKRVFPYGNGYGWGISHKKKSKLMCNIFVENGAFSVMMRLTNKQYDLVYMQVLKYTQNIIDNKFPCSDGGWIHYRVTCQEQYEDVKKLLAVKCE